jgi:hypothetical protein
MHRLSINLLTKRGKEKSPFNGHFQCKKEIEDHLLTRQQFLKRSHELTRYAYEQTSSKKISEINDISFILCLHNETIVLVISTYLRLIMFRESSIHANVPNN